MADLLQTGAAWLGGVLKAHASRSVTYRRGATEVSVASTRGRSEHEALDEDGLRTVFEGDDELIAAADLVAGGITMPPRPGDQVVDGTETFEVLPPGPDRPCYKYSDRGRTRLRIHVKRVE